jgi:hypothetical protein
MKRRTHALGVALLTLVVSSVTASSQSRPLSQGPYRIEIVLERNEKGSWHAIDSRLVLDQNDLVRFRMRANFSGYLYVTNQSTSGKYEVLFPGANSGRENKIEAGREYLIPATQGSFRVTGPAGQEVVYWVVSPVELNSAKPIPQPRNDTPKPSNPPTLIPRCDDTLLRARGDCMDTSAGPKQLQKSDLLPDDLKKFPDLASRDLLFIRQEGSSVISSSTPLNGPVIYEFRLAHR